MMAAEEVEIRKQGKIKQIVNDIDWSAMLKLFTIKI